MPERNWRPLLELLPARWGLDSSAGRPRPRLELLPASDPAIGDARVRRVRCRRCTRAVGIGGTAAPVLVVAALVLAVGCRPTPPLKPRVEGDDPVSRTAAYLIARGKGLDPGALLVLAYVERKFHLDWTRELVGSVREMLYDPQLFRTVGAFARMVDAGVAESMKDSITATVESFRDVPTSWVLLRGLYCDWTPLPSDFGDYLSAPREGLRHWKISTLMAMAYLKANNCLEAGERSSLEELVRAQLGRFLAGAAETHEALDAATVEDFVETVGGFYFAFGRDSVDPVWVERVIEAQLPEGIWGSQAVADSDRDLTAVWGLLALLEYFRPDVEPVSPIPAG